MIRLLAYASLLLGVLSTTAAHADICAVDQRPGATLLIPWFAVDLDQPNGLGTRFWVRNVSTSPKLTNVTLWSDYGVPAFGFNVFLPAYGTARIDLGALLRDGTMPRSGVGISGVGSFDATGTPLNFPLCHAGTTVGIPPVYANLSEAQQAEFGARLTGKPGQSGLCFGSDSGDNVARGYVTVDSVNQCGSQTPADAAYFDAVATNDNVLLGGVEYVDRDNNFAFAAPALSQEAQTGGFVPGDATFYGRKVASFAIDEREPLPFSWAFDFDGVSDSGVADLLVWRSTPITQPRACNQTPAWYPLADAERTPFDPAGDTPLPDPFFLGGRTPIGHAAQQFPTGLIDESLLEPSPPAGSGRINLTNFIVTDAQPDGQSWVGVRHSSAGRFSELQPARALDSGCQAGRLEPAAVGGPVQFNPTTTTYVFRDGYES